MARWYAGLALLVLLTATHGVSARASADGPCPPAKPPAHMVRQVSHVFEGVLVDRWNDVIADRSDRRPRTRRHLRVLRSYRFQVLRSWTDRSPSIELTHGWYEGSPYGKGMYPDYQLGERCLVFAVVHDSPAHSFTSSCLPGAKGADIDRLAAELPPPLATFELAAPPRQPFWTAPARRAGEYAEALRALLMIAVD
jgi:hypothetical protein